MGHLKLGYEVYFSKGEYNRPEVVLTTNDNYGCATEWVALFKTREKQQVIELKNYLVENKINQKDLHNKIKFETKHYVFVYNGHRFVLEGYNDSVKQNTSGLNIIAALGEIIHRKNARIAKLERDVFYAKADSEKYKKMLFDLYNKMQEKPENDMYWEILEFIYGKDDKDAHSRLCEYACKKVRGEK